MLTLAISVEDFSFYNRRPAVQGLPGAHPIPALLRQTLVEAHAILQNHMALRMDRRLERVQSSSNR